MSNTLSHIIIHFLLIRRFSHVNRRDKAAGYHASEKIMDEVIANYVALKVPLKKMNAVSVLSYLTSLHDIDTILL